MKKQETIHLLDGQRAGVERAQTLRGAENNGDNLLRKVSRRTFGLTAIAGAACVSSCGQRVVLKAERGADGWIRVAQSELAAAGYGTARIQGAAILVKGFWNEAQVLERVVALNARCTHLGCEVTPAETSLTCACHQSSFSWAGEVRRGPAPSALEEFQTEIDEEFVYVKVR